MMSETRKQIGTVENEITGRYTYNKVDLLKRVHWPKTYKHQHEIGNS